MGKKKQVERMRLPHPTERGHGEEKGKVFVYLRGLVPRAHVNISCTATATISDGTTHILLGGEIVGNSGVVVSVVSKTDTTGGTPASALVVPWAVRAKSLPLISPEPAVDWEIAQHNITRLQFIGGKDQQQAQAGSADAQDE